MPFVLLLILICLDTAVYCIWLGEHKAIRKTLNLIRKFIRFLNYLNTGTGYAWAGQSMAKLMPHLRSIPDHFTSPDNVGALALTGSLKYEIQISV